MALNILKAQGNVKIRILWIIPKNLAMFEKLDFGKWMSSAIIYSITKQTTFPEKSYSLIDVQQEFEPYMRILQ